MPRQHIQIDGQIHHIGTGQGAGDGGVHVLHIAPVDFRVPHDVHIPFFCVFEQLCGIGGAAYADAGVVKRAVLLLGQSRQLGKRGA